MLRTVLGAATVLTMLAASADHPALAQRATSSPSSTLLGTGGPATPPPPGFPQSNLVWGGTFETHLQAELTKQDRSDAKATAFDDSDLSLYANYANWLSAYSDIRLERQRQDNASDFYPDRNSFFRSEGLTMRQLFATLRPSRELSLYAGKIHPAFGSAYELAPGNFYNFASDYEQDERIGGGVAYRIPDRLGLTSLQISAEAFFLDTTPLSNLLLSRPGIDDPLADRARRYTLGQFGPSNTNKPESFTLAVRGGQPERGLTYQISLTRETTLEPGGRAELGESIGASYDPTGDGIPIGPRLGLTPFLEYTHFDNFGGTAGLEAHYLIGGLTFTRARLQIALAAGLRANMLGAVSTLDHQENLSVNYEVNPRLTVGGGINYINVSGQGGSWSFGPSLSYAIGF
ncbi:MAG: hypothetical protein ACREFL_13750 [Stellaceae bacterium]